MRAAGTAFYERSRKWFTWLHLKILTAIVCCRTSKLGGHIDKCSGCGHRVISFNRAAIAIVRSATGEPERNGSKSVPLNCYRLSTSMWFSRCPKGSRRWRSRTSG